MVGEKRNGSKEDRGVGVLIGTTFLSAIATGSIVQFNMQLATTPFYPPHTHVIITANQIKSTCVCKDRER